MTHMRIEIMDDLMREFFLLHMYHVIYGVVVHDYIHIETIRH
jgi:hypothetical protein